MKLSERLEALIPRLGPLMFASEVMELVEVARELEAALEESRAQVAKLQDNIDSVCEVCAEKCRCHRAAPPGEPARQEKP